MAGQDGVASYVNTGIKLDIIGAGAGRMAGQGGGAPHLLYDQHEYRLGGGAEA